VEAHVVVEFAAQTETANICLKVRRHAMRLKILGLLSQQNLTFDVRQTNQPDNQTNSSNARPETNVQRYRIPGPQKILSHLNLNDIA